MDLSSKFQPNKEALFQQTYLKALLDNKNNLSQWKGYKERYEEVIKNLQFYTEKSKHAVCIPVGKKAFVKGHLVHTNDVWVTLGSGWFLKTSAKKAIEICERRIKEANELIEKWEKENKLLESMKEYSVSKDTFGGEDSKEIVEPFDEDKEKNWKKEHREKERKYKQQLKELREKTGSANLKDEKDIWAHLEELELQEELEDELNRLGNDDTSSDEQGTEQDSDDISSSEDEEPEEIVEEAVENSEPEPQRKLIEILNSVNLEDKSVLSDDTESSKEKNRNTRKKVSFKEADNVVHDLKVEKISPENIEDAVLDVVIEKEAVVSNTGKESEQNRPMSKFKMKRMSSK